MKVILRTKQFLANLFSKPAEFVPFTETEIFTAAQLRNHWTVSMKFHQIQALLFAFLFPLYADAASLEGTLTNLVNALLSKIFPILALGYLGKNIFSHIQADPNAKHETVRVVVATACLLGISGVWSFIQQQVR